jgi:hypothetical protein
VQRALLERETARARALAVGARASLLALLFPPPRAVTAGVTGGDSSPPLHLPTVSLLSALTADGLCDAPAVADALAAAASDTDVSGARTAGDALVVAVARGLASVTGVPAAAAAYAAVTSWVTEVASAEAAAAVAAVGAHSRSTVAHGQAGGTLTAAFARASLCATDLSAFNLAFTRLGCGAPVPVLDAALQYTGCALALARGLCLRALLLPLLAHARTHAPVTALAATPAPTLPQVRGRGRASTAAAASTLAITAVAPAGAASAAAVAAAVSGSEAEAEAEAVLTVTPLTVTALTVAMPTPRAPKAESGDAGDGDGDGDGDSDEGDDGGAGADARAQAHARARALARALLSSSAAYHSLSAAQLVLCFLPPALPLSSPPRPSWVPHAPALALALARTVAALLGAAAARRALAPQDQEALTRSLIEPSQSSSPAAHALLLRQRARTARGAIDAACARACVHGHAGWLSALPSLLASIGTTTVGFGAGVGASAGTGTRTLPAAAAADAGAASYELARAQVRGTAPYTGHSDADAAVALVRDLAASGLASGDSGLALIAHLLERCYSGGGGGGGGSSSSTATAPVANVVQSALEAVAARLYTQSHSQGHTAAAAPAAAGALSDREQYRLLQGLLAQLTGGKRVSPGAGSIASCDDVNIAAVAASAPSLLAAPQMSEYLATYTACSDVGEAEAEASVAAAAAAASTAAAAGASVAAAVAAEAASAAGAGWFLSIALSATDAAAVFGTAAAAAADAAAAVGAAAPKGRGVRQLLTSSAQRPSSSAGDADGPAADGDDGAGGDSGSGSGSGSGSASESDPGLLAAGAEAGEQFTRAARGVLASATQALARGLRGTDDGQGGRGSVRRATKRALKSGFGTLSRGVRAAWRAAMADEESGSERDSHGDDQGGHDHGDDVSESRGDTAAGDRSDGDAAGTSPVSPPAAAVAAAAAASPVRAAAASPVTAAASPVAANTAAAAAAAATAVSPLTSPATVRTSAATASLPPLAAEPFFAPWQWLPMVSSSGSGVDAAAAAPDAEAVVAVASVLAAGDAAAESALAALYAVTYTSLSTPLDGLSLLTWISPSRPTAAAAAARLCLRHSLNTRHSSAADAATTAPAASASADGVGAEDRLLWVRSAAARAGLALSSALSFAPIQPELPHQSRHTMPAQKVQVHAALSLCVGASGPSLLAPLTQSPDLFTLYLSSLRCAATARVITVAGPSVAAVLGACPRALFLAPPELAQSYSQAAPGCSQAAWQVHAGAPLGAPSSSVSAAAAATAFAGGLFGALSGSSSGSGSGGSGRLRFSPGSGLGLGSGPGSDAGSGSGSSSGSGSGPAAGAGAGARPLRRQTASSTLDAAMLEAIGTENKRWAALPVFDRTSAATAAAAASAGITAAAAVAPPPPPPQTLVGNALLEVLHGLTSALSPARVPEAAKLQICFHALAPVLKAIARVLWVRLRRLDGAGAAFASAAAAGLAEAHGAAAAAGAGRAAAAGGRVGVFALLNKLSGGSGGRSGVQRLSTGTGAGVATGEDVALGPDELTAGICVVVATAQQLAAAVAALDAHPHPHLLGHLHGHLDDAAGPAAGAAGVGLAAAYGLLLRVRARERLWVSARTALAGLCQAAAHADGSQSASNGNQAAGVLGALPDAAAPSPALSSASAAVAGTLLCPAPDPAPSDLVAATAAEMPALLRRERAWVATVADAWRRATAAADACAPDAPARDADPIAGAAADASADVGVDDELRAAWDGLNYLARASASAAAPGQIQTAMLCAVIITAGGGVGGALARLQALAADAARAGHSPAHAVAARVALAPASSVWDATAAGFSFYRPFLRDCASVVAAGARSLSDNFVSLFAAVCGPVRAAYEADSARAYADEHDEYRRLRAAAEAAEADARALAADADAAAARAVAAARTGTRGPGSAAAASAAAAAAAAAADARGPAARARAAVEALNRSRSAAAAAAWPAEAGGAGAEDGTSPALADPLHLLTQHSGYLVKRASPTTARRVLVSICSQLDAWLFEGWVQTPELHATVRRRAAADVAAVVRAASRRDRGQRGAGWRRRRRVGSLGGRGTGPTLCGAAVPALLHGAGRMGPWGARAARAATRAFRAACRRCGGRGVDRRRRGGCMVHRGDGRRRSASAGARGAAAAASRARRPHRA